MQAFTLYLLCKKESKYTLDLTLKVFFNYEDFFYLKMIIEVYKENSKEWQRN